MIKKLLILIVSIGLTNYSIAQNCSIKMNDRIEFFKANYERETQPFLSLKFEINGQKFTTADTTTKTVKINPGKFDSISYSYVNFRGEKIKKQFICKLINGELYTISPCTCCGIFLMTPEKNPKRGFVKFINLSQKEFMAMVSEMDYETIEKESTTEFIFSSISMNCGFRPSTVFIADSNYLNSKFMYENWSTKSIEGKRELEIEQETYIVDSFDFLFIHEERLIVTINKQGTKFSVDIED